eukprot:8110318-Pyramimonas_sp.AAC.1
MTARADDSGGVRSRGEERGGGLQEKENEWRGGWRKCRRGSPKAEDGVRSAENCGGVRSDGDAGDDADENPPPCLWARSGRVL